MNNSYADQKDLVFQRSKREDLSKYCIRKAPIDDNPPPALINPDISFQIEEFQKKQAAEKLRKEAILRIRRGQGRVHRGGQYGGMWQRGGFFMTCS